MTRPLLCCVVLLLSTATAPGQDETLAGYFGFEALEVVKIGRGAGPMTVADMNGDGLDDLVVVNNHASRIEVHEQRPGASPEDAPAALARPNELPEHWRFRKVLVSVSHRVEAVVPRDFDGDGRMDLIYAGSPTEIVFLRQGVDGRFAVSRRHRVRDLNTNRNGFAVADVLGDDAAELLALVGGKIHVWPLDGDDLGQPTVLSAGADIVAFMLADYTGEGRTDIAAVVPEDAAPVRLWCSKDEGGLGVLGPQARFEMPPLIELDPVRLPGRPAACIAVIERPSKRILLYEVVVEPIEQDGNRDAAIDVFGFTDPGSRDRSVTVVDLDGDGLLDLVATDTQANALVAYRQAPGKGLQPGRVHPCYAELDVLVAGDVDGDAYAELFVLSEKEGVVGRCDVTPEGIPYPSPLTIPDGTTPVALNLVDLDAGPRVAVIVKDKRDYAIALLGMDGATETIPLGSLSRSPDTIIPLDADQDGRTDLLLFTRDKPMTMLHAAADGFRLLESDDMGQYGLVKSARSDNTVVFDIDGDEHPELLIADRNYVRAVRYEPNPAAGISPGWQVVEQINAADSTSKLVSLAVLGRRIVAADRENDRLVIMARTRAWQETESINIKGFSFNAVHAGAFSGDGLDNILAVGTDGFGVIRLAGEGLALRELSSWRTDEERRRQHELAAGDLNGDGFTDLVSLDAGEQMCEIFTISESGRLLYALGFQVFESKLFSGGDAREFEPSAAVVADVTGDGGQDLLLLAHDRVLIYPQMTSDGPRARRD